MNEIKKAPLRGVVTFYDYVLAPREINHSGVLSPMGWLDPQWEYPTRKRLQALEHLTQWVKDYPTAYRAVEWCATNDADAKVKAAAQAILENL